ncbi:MAG: hypothetical protein K9G36_04205 [Crocinitomicaceae bacterium]|jgi:hypothetical protein|nr:hypothetical protein [Crocinitomicaceae bacterium]MCF8410438.1 hypothetical protein [Crocinitomicaceae bacterium]
MIIPDENTNSLRIKNSKIDNKKAVNPAVLINNVAFLLWVEIAIPRVKQREKIRNIFNPIVIFKLLEVVKKLGSSKKP